MDGTSGLSPELFGKKPGAFVFGYNGISMEYQ
jgi:hypothetical protein